MSAIIWPSHSLPPPRLHVLSTSRSVCRTINHVPCPCARMCTVAIVCSSLHTVALEMVSTLIQSCVHVSLRLTCHQHCPATPGMPAAHVAPSTTRSTPRPVLTCHAAQTNKQSSYQPCSHTNPSHPPLSLQHDRRWSTPHTHTTGTHSPLANHVTPQPLATCSAHHAPCTAAALHAWRASSQLHTQCKKHDPTAGVPFDSEQPWLYPVPPSLRCCSTQH